MAAKDMIIRKETSRGFIIYEEDIPAGREHTLRVQESSRAFDGAHVWIFADGPDHTHKGTDHELNVQSAKRLIAALQAFVYDAEAGFLTEPAEALKENSNE